uniref:Gametocyte-specific factor 1 n=1 Tax=Rhipicephalus zambeziensis TaxID=60191 RepID=A0A224YD43_9ACAR
MPPMPKTESKVLMHLKAMEAMQRKNGAVLGDDSDSGDESDQQFKSKVYRMGLGRGYASAAAVKARAEQKSEEDSEAEIRARMRLMGLGRGKPLPRN